MIFMVKTFTYRGKTLQELQSMSNEEVAKLMPSRQRKTILKGFNKKVVKRIENNKKILALGKIPKAIRTHLRDFTIMPNMVGLQFGVHTGKEFFPVLINEEMIGHYLGEYALTRQRVRHGKAGIGATKSSTGIATRK